MSDAHLAARIADGDPEAEAEVCRRMGPRIRLYGLRHLRSASAADDLVQQVLLKMLEALRAGRLREPDKLAQFALGTCRMTVVDLRRSARRQERLLAEFGADLMPDQPPMPQLDDAQLARCVQTLKERERSVVVLTFYDEQTAAEAAGFLGISEANVRVIRHRAVRQLRACMESHGMTTPPGRVPVDCSQPIEAAVLMDYWLGALPSADEEAVEEHLLSCDGCGDRLREVIALAEGLRTLARSGSLQVVISDQFVKHAAETGQRVREYAPPPGGSVQCTVAADDDLLVARLAADLSGAARVDLSWCDGQGVEVLRMADIPIRA